jgi:hypothetical protein
MICSLSVPRPLGRAALLAISICWLCVRTCSCSVFNAACKGASSACGHFQFWPVAHAIPFAFQAVAVLQGDAASALGQQLHIAMQALADAGLTAQPFLFNGGHSHQSQGVRIAGDETILCGQHRPGIGAIGFDAFVLVVPVARADDMVSHAQGGKLPMQSIAEGTGFVTGDDAPALGDLFLYPHQ